MKIASSLRLVAPAQTDAVARRSPDAPAPRGNAATAAFSGAADVVGAMRAEAAEHGVHGDVRPGVVAAMRAEIQAGTLGSPQDIERALDALMDTL